MCAIHDSYCKKIQEVRKIKPTTAARCLKDIDRLWKKRHGYKIATTASAILHCHVKYKCELNNDNSNSKVPQNRITVQLASQCIDSDGPGLLPDFFDRRHFGARPAADCGQEKNGQLGRSASDRVGERHYARSCLDFQVPEDCLVVDGIDPLQVDIVVNIAQIGSCTARNLVVMACNLAYKPTWFTIFGSLLCTTRSFDVQPW